MSPDYCVVVSISLYSFIYCVIIHIIYTYYITDIIYTFNLIWYTIYTVHYLYTYSYCTSLTLGAHAQRGLQYLVCHSVRLSVCYHVFCHYAQQGGQKAIPTGSVPHWLDFKNGDFRKSTAFKSYGLKTKRTSQLLMSMTQILPVSEHCGGSTRNTKGEYVVLVCQTHYLPT